MTARADTIALARPVPYLMQVGETQELSAPLRYGPIGALVPVTEAGSTVTITRPDGSDLVSDAPVTVTSSIATYSVSPAASETLGRGWTVTWSLIVDGQTYTFRESAYLCQYYPHNVVSVADLYTEVPDLAYNVPQAQGDSGTGVGWQPQVDQAYYDFIRRLIDNGRPVWLLREHTTGVREWILSRGLQRCITTIPRKEGSTWAAAEKTAYFRMQAANAGLRLQYDDEDSGIRRGGSPVIRLAPFGRW